MNHINKIHISRAFNRSANTYNHACDMQKFSGEKLIQLLNKNNQYETVLDVGCGTGLITETLLQSINFHKCYGVDFSSASLEELKNNAKLNKVKVMLTDFDNLPLHDPQFSLVFSNMALHWSIDFNKLLQKIHAILLQGATLAFSIPLNGTLKEIPNTSVGSFPLSQHIITELIKQNFTVSHAAHFRYIKRFHSIIDALHSLKMTGVTQLNPQSHKGLKHKNYLLSLYKDDNNNPKLTYEIGIFIARKS